LVFFIEKQGSCQFPTLGFVVEQYWRRERFIPEDFWSITAAVDRDGLKANFTWRKGRLFDRQICMILYQQCVDSPMATVTSVVSKPTRKWCDLIHGDEMAEMPGGHFL
jgi:DNA topoisomerase-3